MKKNILLTTSGMSIESPVNTNVNRKTPRTATNGKQTKVEEIKGKCFFMSAVASDVYDQLTKARNITAPENQLPIG
jgi:hypothetical protein